MVPRICFPAPGTKINAIYGNKISEFLNPGTNTDALGKVYSGAFITQPGAFSYVHSNDTYDGLHFFDSNLGRIDDLEVIRIGSTIRVVFSRCLRRERRRNNFYADYVYCSVTGSTNLITLRRRSALWLDGQIAGASLKSYIEGSCGGEGLRVSNDIGSTKTAFGITVDYPSLEFTTDPGVHITGNAYEIAINKGFWVGSGWKNFVSCQASAGLVIDNGSHNISVDGGQIAASSGAGVYSNGTNITFRPGGVFNNSNPNAGGTKNTCAGIEFGALSSGGVVSGAAIGYTFGQAEPVLLDSGAQNISVTGNSFLAGNLLNHVVNNSPKDGNMISCNAGADINDCTSALGNSGIEFVYPSSGSVGSSGALSVNTAIDNAYTQSYV